MKFLLRFLCRILFVLNSTMLVIIIFNVKEYFKDNIFKYEIWIGILLFTLIIAVMILLAKIAIYLVKYLDLDNLKPPYNDISDINSSYLAAYLGYFFVSLSINDVVTLTFIYLFLIVLAYHTLNQYYNPILILMGYKFYSIKSRNDIVVLIITKRYIRSNDTMEFKQLRRLHDGCYFDEEE